MTSEEYFLHGTRVRRISRPGHAARPLAVPPPEVKTVALSEPTPAELAANFAGAMGQWIKAGLPVVTEVQYAARTAACESCELWDGEARLGLGKCKAPGCGCTKFKRWLATERCKHPEGPRWPAL